MTDEDEPGLGGRKAIWIWEYSQQAEQQIEQVAETALQLAGCDTVLLKAMDGTDWMSAYDRGTGAIDGLETWQATVRRGAVAGINVLPWVVPHGQSPASEAGLHVQLGQTLICDIEPYTGFFTAGPGNVPVYLAALREAGAGRIYASIDPRPSAIAALDVSSWASLVDGFLPQVYFTDFGGDPLDVIPMLGRVCALGKPVVPVLPGIAQAGDLRSVWALAQVLGCTGVSVWRLGSMNRDQLQAFAGLGMQSPSTDSGQAAALQWRITVAEKALAAAGELLAGVDGPARSGLVSAVADIDALAEALQAQAQAGSAGAPTGKNPIAGAPTGKNPIAGAPTGKNKGGNP